MAVATQVFRTLITADSSKAVNEYKKYGNTVTATTAKAEKAQGRLTAATKAYGPMVAAVGATAALAMGKHAVNAARDLEESVNAVNVMYGRSADAVQGMGANAATEMGLSARAFNESAVAVGGFVEQISDINGAPMEDVLKDLMMRAADFASVYNIDVDEALQRFRSGLAGETEPLRRFGVNLLQSEVKAYALANGITEVGEAMTEEEKVLARFELLMEKTAKTAGDFANTSGNLANQQRTLRGQLENLSATVGDVAIPHLEKLADRAIMVGEGFQFMMKDLDALEGRIDDLLPGDQTTLDIVGDAWDFIDPMTLGPLGKAAEDYGKSVWSSFKGALEDAGLKDPPEIELSDLAKKWTPDNLEFELGMIRKGNKDLFPELSDEGRRQANKRFADSLNSLDWELEQIRGSSAGAAEGVEDVGDGLSYMEQQADLAAKRLSRVESAFKDLRDEMADRSAWLDVVDAAVDFEDAIAAAEEATEEFGAGSKEAMQANRDMERALIDRIGAIQDYVTETEGIPDEVVTLISLLLEQGEIDEAEDLIETVERTRTVELALEVTNIAASDRAIQNFLSSRSGRVARGLPVDPIPVRPAGSAYNPNINQTGVGARGGVVTRPTMSLIGEAGPEAVIPLDQMPGASPLRGGMGGITVNVNAGIGTDGAQVGRLVVEEIKRFERRNGAGWRN